MGAVGSFPSSNPEGKGDIHTSGTILLQSMVGGEGEVKENEHGHFRRITYEAVDPLDPLIFFPCGSGQSISNLDIALFSSHTMSPTK